MYFTGALQLKRCSGVDIVNYRLVVRLLCININTVCVTLGLLGWACVSSFLAGKMQLIKSNCPSHQVETVPLSKVQQHHTDGHCITITVIRITLDSQDHFVLFIANDLKIYSEYFLNIQNTWLLTICVFWRGYVS